MQSTLLQKSMRIADILTLLPQAERLLAQYGLHCSGCSIGGAETLEDALSMHGMSEEDVGDLMADLHVLLEDRPERPQTIAITETAAIALTKILDAEKKTGWVLRVGLDATGGFHLEIVKEVPADDHVFMHHGLTVSASPLTLAAIGGATIDEREGRFKLDVPGAGAACACGGECSCR